MLKVPLYSPFRMTVKSSASSFASGLTVSVVVSSASL